MPRASPSPPSLTGLRSTIFMPAAAAAAEGRGHPGLRRRRRPRPRAGRRLHRRAQAFAAETGPSVRAAVRRPADHRRAGHARPGAGRGCTRRRASSSCRSAAAGCWPGSPPRSADARPDVRVIGVEAEGAAAMQASLVAGQPGRARRRAHHRRRHRREVAVGPHAGPRPGVLRRRRHRHRRGDRPGARAAARAGQAGRRAGRRRGPGRADGRQGRPATDRRWPCCRAATSTR